MSIAWRNRSWDFRASAIAASASARLRPTSATATAWRPRIGSLGPAFTGRPVGLTRGVTGNFSRFRVRGRLFGIGTPRSHSAKLVFQQVSEKKVSLDRDGRPWTSSLQALYTKVRLFRRPEI